MYSMTLLFCCVTLTIYSGAGELVALHQSLEELMHASGQKTPAMFVAKDISGLHRETEEYLKKYEMKICHGSMSVKECQNSLSEFIISFADLYVQITRQ